MYNLFLPRDKQEKIDELTRILKNFEGGERSKIPTRDYYNRLNTYRGSKLEPDGRPIPLQEQPVVPNLRIDENNEIVFDEPIHLKVIDGPMHKKRARGPALQLETGGFVASITYSRVNIKDTNYSWWRIERNRAWMGYVSWGDVTNKNFGTKYTEKDVGNDCGEKPGLYQHYKRCQRIKDRLGEAHYKKLLIQSMDDKWARTYWYFIVKNGVNRLPNKYHERDYDNINEELPVYEKDFLYDHLDNQLKQCIYETVKKNLGKKEDMPKVPKHRFSVNDIINIIKDNTDDELTNIARTVAIARAKEWKLLVGGPRTTSGIRDDDRDDKPNQQYRLHEEYYSKNAGINIPDEYFEIDWRIGARYKHMHSSKRISYASKRMQARLQQDRQKSSSPPPQTPQQTAIKNEIQHLKEIEIQKEYWPITTYTEYRKSFSRFKLTALVYAHVVNSILRGLKPLVFDDSTNTFMGEYHLDGKQYGEIKEWFNYVCDNLRKETADLLSNMRADKRLEREDIRARGLLNPGRAHLFEPSGPRLRNRRRRTPVRRQQADNEEDQAFDDLMNAVEEDEALENLNVNHVAAEIDRIAGMGPDFYLWNRLIQILGQPIAALNERIALELDGTLEEKIARIPAYEIYRFQTQYSHAQDNRAQWAEIREICRRWDAGINTPTADVRTEAVRLAFPRGWPNNTLDARPPPIHAHSPQQDPIQDHDDGISLKMWAQAFCLQAMPAILAILHKKVFWNIANPIKTIDGVTTIMPGCDWFKHMIFSLVTVEGYIPLGGLSPKVRNWLIPDAYTNYPLTNNPSGPFVFGAAGMDEFGYVKGNEFYGNIVEQKMAAQYAMWSNQHSSHTNYQESLKKLAEGFQSNTQVTMNEVVAAFQKKSSIDNLHSYLGENVNVYTEVDRIPKNMLVPYLHESISARWGQALVTCQRTEMDMYLQMEHLCWWWAGCSILFFLLEGQMGPKFKNIDALSLLKMGITTGMGYYNYAYKFANLDEQQVQDIPRLVLGAQKTLFMASFVFTGQVYAALLDDRVDEKNEHLVRRLTNRRSWFSWERLQANIGEYIQPFRVRHTRFIQESKRFKRDANNVWDNDQILESNKPRHAPAAKYQLAWDIDQLNRPIQDDTLNSKTCTRNIHYPPGCIFKYKDEDYIVVDDLHSMYQHRTITEAGPNFGLTQIQSRIRQEFPNYQFQTFPNEWADLEGVREKIDAIRDLFSKIVTDKFSQQYRVCVRLSHRNDGEPNIRIVSVAAKNYAQSIKNTVLFATGATLLMEYNQCDFNAPDMRMLSTGIMAMSSVENENTFYPAVTGLAASFAVTSQIGNASQPQQFIGLGAAWATNAAMYRFVIDRAQQYEDDERLHHYLRQGLGLLIPMELRRVNIGERIVWGGKLWCPLTGRMHEFNATPWVRGRNAIPPPDAVNPHNVYNDANAQDRRPLVRLHRNPYYNQRRLVEEIEDAFELTQRGEQLLMRFYYWRLEQQGWNKIVDSTWVYTPTPHSKNLFFICTR